jgi:WD40 repeat protein
MPSYFAVERRPGRSRFWLGGFIVLTAACATGQDEERNADHSGQRASRPARVDLLGDPLPQHALLRLGTRRFRNADGVTELAVNGAEDLVITIDRESVIAWDAQTGQQRWRVPHRVETSTISTGAAAYGVRALAFAPDGRTFYTSGQAGTLLVWDSTSGQHAPLEIDGAADAAAEPFRSIDVGRDGRLALGNSKALLICNTDGDVVHAIPNPIEAPMAFDGKDRLTFGGDFSYGRFSSDGTSVAIVNSAAPRTIRIVDAESGEDRQRIDLSARLVRMDFAPDGGRIVTTERDIAIRMYDAGSGQRVWERVLQPENEAESYTSAVEISPDGELVAAGAPLGSDYRIRLLDAGTGDETGNLTGHEWKPWTLAFTADSRSLYSSGWNGEILHWDLSQRQQIPLPIGTRATGVCAAAPRGGRLAYAGQDSVIRIVSATEGAEERKLTLGFIEYGQMGFSPDGRLLAAGGQGAGQMHLAVWDVESGALQHHWQWPVGRDPHSSVESLSFSSDGQRVAVAMFRQHRARVYDLVTDLLQAEFEHRSIYGLSFGPPGDELATAGWDSTVRLWDVSTGTLQRSRETKEIRQGDFRMYGVRISPDGRTLATANMDGSVWIWNLDDLTLRHVLATRGNFTSGSISFSPGGQWLAVGSGNEVTLWDPYSGQQVWSGGLHENTVYTVDFGRDDRTLLTGGRDGVCYQWDLAPGDLPMSRDPAVLYQDLISPEGPAAYRAQWALAGNPQSTIEFLASELETERDSIDARQVLKLITELDADGFAERESAQLELARMGPSISGQLRQARDASKSAEQKSRLEEVLAAIDRATARRGLSIHRALSVLEQIGSPEAIALIEQIAKDDTGSTTARIAREVLTRLK